MDSQIPISLQNSSEEALLQPQLLAPPKKRKPNRISIFFVILFTVISGGLILSVLYKQDVNIIRWPFNPRPSITSNEFICYETRYPELCLNSISSITPTKSQGTNLTQIFSASLRFAIDRLVRSRNLLPESVLTLPNSDELQKCVQSVNYSVSRLNQTLATLGVDLDVESLTYEEMDEMMTRIEGAIYGTRGCSVALDDLRLRLSADGSEGLAEVTWGVDEAWKYAKNGYRLLASTDYILNKFYNIRNDEYRHDEYYDVIVAYYNFDYGLIFFVFSAEFVFLAILYILFLCSG